MKSLKKTTNRIIVLSALFLSVILIFLYYFYKNNQSEELGCGNKEIVPICGTKNLSSKAQEGKQLFNSTCAACHKLDSKSTGPAFRNTDSLVYKKWLSYKRLEIDTTKFEKLKVDYHRNLSKNNFTDSDLEKIYAYLSGS